MVNMSLAEAAAWAGRSKPTIHKAITKGRLSAPKDEQGRLQIDPAELERVFGPLKPPQAATGSPTVAIYRSDTDGETLANAREIQLLRERVQSLEADKADLRAERDRLLGIVDANTRLLAHHAETQTVVRMEPAKTDLREMPPLRRALAVLFGKVVF